MKLSGEVEVHESLFGHRCKYHRGQIKSRVQVWVHGLVERGSGKMILYLIEKRDRPTLEGLILRLGSTIYTDGWGGYRGPNALGYSHFRLYTKTHILRNTGISTTPTT